MDRGRTALVGALIVSIGAAGWLFLDNRNLRKKLDSAQVEANDTETTATNTKTRSTATNRRRRRRGTAESFIDTIRRAATRTRPKLKKHKKESRLERRKRRMAILRAILGRMDGETAKEYRLRMVPVIKDRLSKPRARVAALRKKAEDAADVTDEQRTKLDDAFDDVYSELIQLTNKSVKDGELTPYERNWKGLLSYAGGLGAVLDNAEVRIGKILSPKQQAAIYDSGFEWGEYLGVTAPWERLDAPPPEPDNGGG